jgi:hypothetical protein
MGRDLMSVPCAACCTLREISCVAAPCSSTAAAMVDEISDSFSMVPLISLIAPTDSCAAGQDRHQTTRRSTWSAFDINKTHLGPDG